MIPRPTIAERFLMRGLAEQLRPRIPASGQARTQFWRNRHHQSPIPSRILRDDSGSIDIRKTRFGLRHALGCGLAAVIDRALSHSARTAYPFGSLLACSLSGTPDLCNRCFQSDCNLLPAYAVSSGNLAAIRNVSPPRLRATEASSGHSADPYSLQSL
jgi:hypothetical protein